MLPGRALERAGYIAGLPFLFGAVATWVGGLFTDWLSRRMPPARARQLVGFTALVSAGTLMLVGIMTPAALPGALLMASAAFAGDMVLGPIWTSAVGLGGGAGGTAGGLLNTTSNLGGFVSPIIIGWSLDVWGDWSAVLLLAVMSNFVAAALWWPANRRAS